MEKGCVDGREGLRSRLAGVELTGRGCALVFQTWLSCEGLLRVRNRAHEASGQVLGRYLVSVKFQHSFTMGRFQRLGVNAA